MENSVGLMTVFAVLGSMVHVALQAHKCLLSDFMKNVEWMVNACSHSQFQSTHGILKIHKGSKVEQKKKVRFADDVVEPSSNNEVEGNECRSNMDRSSYSCNSQ
ncbi:hypothetical protein MKW92_023845 [Papaver armeniacum]|nr:hypothetical protein MKW92_023845 [Papaver armeniacum]